MKVHCKDATVDNCPMELTTCCYVCDHKATCDCACEHVNDDYQNCSSYEVITDELIQFQSAAPEAIQQITQLVIMKKQLEDQEKQLKYELTKAMEAYGIKSFENEHIKMVYVAPTTRSTIDSTRLKKDHPDLAKEYTKTSDVSASVRITVK